MHKLFLKELLVIQSLFLQLMFKKPTLYKNLPYVMAMKDFRKSNEDNLLF